MTDEEIRNHWKGKKLRIRQTASGLEIQFSIKLPAKKRPSKKYYPNLKHIPITATAPVNVLKALARYSKKLHLSESDVVREAITYFFIQLSRSKPQIFPLRKAERIALGKKCSWTITIDQDKRLRRLSEMTGRSFGELLREALVNFLRMRKYLS